MNYAKNITAFEALRILEGNISEGLLLPKGIALPEKENVFGRLPVQFHSNDLSSVAGPAANGLRAAAFLPAGDMLSNYGRLADAVRQHLGMIVHMLEGEGTITGDLHYALHAVSGAGCFQFFSSNAQEAVDLAIIAHKVAERSLVPGIHVVGSGHEAQPVAIPSRQTLVEFLGSSDDWIESPTPAQRMIFGKMRRRLPNWFNFDFPALTGALKDPRAIMREAAAYERFFYFHLPALIKQAFVEYGDLTGRRYSPVNSYRAADADYLLLVQGSALAGAAKAVDQLREKEKIKAGCLNLLLLRPFPAEDLATLISGKKAVAVLEPVGRNMAVTGPLAAEVKAILPEMGKRPPEFFSGAYGAEPTREEALSAFRNMMRGGEKKDKFYLGVEFTREKSNYPRHEVLLQTIRREYPGIADEPIVVEKTQGETASKNNEKKTGEGRGALDLPLAIRRYKDQGPPFSRLSRFYHDTAYFYQSGEEQEFTADPFQAVSAIPAASAGLTDVAGQRSHIPVFQPETCTGCGKCFVYCPHSALPPLAIGLEPFIKGVMEIAAGRGVPLTPLIPAVKNLARIAGQEIQAVEGKTGRIADFLPAAFEKLAAQMKLPVEKEENLRNAFASFMEIAGELPVSVTDAFFTVPEMRENGAGELFTLAVDPYACTGCGLCAHLCEEEALVMQSQTPELLEKQLSVFSLWEQLPDTASDTITRLVSDENYDPFAAILLSRNFYQSMAGGGLSESGAPAKALLHLATALAESVIQPRMAKQSREIGELIDSLSANIHSKLSEALPSQHFDSLLKALEEAGGRKTPFDEIVGSLGAESHLRLVDTGALQRQVELVNDLKELRRLLTEGSTGNGRARFGAVIPAGSFSWADRFPYNPFLSPVLLNDEGASAGLLTGLFQGYLRHALDNIRLLRRARLEAKGKYRPEQHAREIASLQWEDLDDAEKGLVPPLLLIGGKTLLDREYLPSLSDLLASPWPVKVFVLDDALATPQGNPAAHFSRRSALLFPALALRNAYVMYGSLDNPKMLFDGLLKGLAGSRPALFYLFAPDPERHDIPAGDWPQLASLAMETRAFPAFRFDPGRASGSLFAGISIEGNPSEEDAWHSLSLPYREGEVNYTRTYADWLFTQEEWISHFQPVELLEGSVVRLPEYLALDEPALKGKTPVILTVDEEGNLFQYSASPAVVAATRAALSYWQTLQEMVGVAKNVPDQIRESLEKEISGKYEKSMADLRAGFEEKLSKQESELMANVKIRLREKLLALAGRGQ